MSLERESGESFDAGPGPLESALVLVAVGVLALYVVGVVVLPIALDWAGLLTSLFAITTTLLWIGDRI